MIKLIYLKEMRTYLKSPITYVFWGIFMLIAGWMFFNLVIYFVEHIQKLPLSARGEHDFSNHIILKSFGNLNFIFILFCSILSMGIFSMEYKRKTIEIYYNSLVRDYELVMAKFLSLLTQALLLLLSTLLLPLVLSNVDIPDFSIVASGYLGMALNLSFFMSIGLFASSLSSNQVLSATLSLVLTLLLWMMPMLSEMTSNFVLTKAIDFLSVSLHFQNFLKGWVSISDFSFYFSGIFFFIYMTKKKIESRGWQ